MKALVLCSVLLSGCAQLQPAKDAAQDIVDDLLTGAEYKVCEAVPVAAVKRRYAANPRRLRAWAEYCEHEWLVRELPNAAEIGR